MLRNFLVKKLLILGMVIVFVGCGDAEHLRKDTDQVPRLWLDDTSTLYSDAHTLRVYTVDEEDYLLYDIESRALGASMGLDLMESISGVCRNNNKLVITLGKTGFGEDGSYQGGILSPPVIHELLITQKNSGTYVVEESRRVKYPDEGTFSSVLVTRNCDVILNPGEADYDEHKDVLNIRDMTQMGVSNPVNIPFDDKLKWAPLDCWPVGCSTYTTIDSVERGNLVFAQLSGQALKRGSRGIYVKNASANHDDWKKMVDESMTRGFIVSPNNCHIAYPTIQKNTQNIFFKNICSDER